MQDVRFTKSVVSVSSVCEGSLRDEIILSDRVRAETLKRCYAIPSYQYKPLAWKNRYYDLIHERVKKEVGMKV